MPLADRPPLRCGLSAVQSFQAHRTIPSLSISNVRPADRPLPRAGPSAPQGRTVRRSKFRPRQKHQSFWTNNKRASGPSAQAGPDRPPQVNQGPILVKLHRRDLKRVQIQPTHMACQGADCLPPLGGLSAQHLIQPNRNV